MYVVLPVAVVYVHYLYYRLPYHLVNITCHVQSGLVPFLCIQEQLPKSLCFDSIILPLLFTHTSVLYERLVLLNLLLETKKLIVKELSVVLY